MVISNNLFFEILDLISFLIFFGSSFLGLSSVKYILLQYLSAILPIIFLLGLSLSPPHPNTKLIFLNLNCSFTFFIQVSRASGV